jgi:hypothetical protein
LKPARPIDEDENGDSVLRVELFYWGPKHSKPAGGRGATFGKKVKTQMLERR